MDLFKARLDLRSQAITLDRGIDGARAALGTLRGIIHRLYPAITHDDYQNAMVAFEALYSLTARAQVTSGLMKEIARADLTVSDPETEEVYVTFHKRVI